MRMNRGQSRTRRGRRTGAFTLLEVLVAVGAVALLTVGIATIFSAIGKTVSGGRRVSVKVGMAAMIEQRLREDFSHITREGFMLIRQQVLDVDANGTITNQDAVELSSTDPAPRARRVDEILFFDRGTFHSSRLPLSDELVVTSNAARIYIGHGQRQSDRTNDPNALDAYRVPKLNDRNATAGYKLGDRTAGNPNRYASDWMLLRHQLLLVPPESADSSRVTRPFLTIADPTTPASRLLLRDKSGQIGGQPAIGGIFRCTNLFPFEMPNDEYLRPLPSPLAHYYSSGLVDIASMDLSEVRSWVMTVVEAPSAYIPNNNGSNYIPIGQTPLGSRLDVTHEWMNNALPTESDPMPQITPRGDDVPGSRMRYEPLPPDLLGASSTGDVMQDALARADQMILTSSNFVPRCSEFIVEWSFGDVDLGGNIVWHGLDRVGDVNGDGLAAANEYVARPYPPLTPAGVAAYHRVPGDDGVLYPMTDRLIYGYPARDYTDGPNSYTADPRASRILTSHFGWVNTEVNPSPLAKAPPAWAWPKLVRITLSYVTDAKKPNVEETLQFVLDVPDADPK